MAVEINYTDPPKKNLEELLSIYKLDRYLILDEVLESNRSFKVIFQDLIDILKNGYEIKEVRTRPIKFKFHSKDRKIHTLELRHFLSNLILWRAFIDIDKVDLLSPLYIYDFSKFNINTLIKYINEMILPVHDGDFASKNECVDEISYAITAIAHAFCPLFGVSLSIHNLIDLEKRYPEIHDIIRGDIPADLQPHEVEDYLTAHTNRLIELITNDPEDNDLKPLFLAGKNISNLQFREYLLHIGLKPDINGNTIPVLINDNFLHRGLTKPSSLYVNASAGRRSLMLTKLSMGIPGAFSKKLNAVATAPGILRQDNEMCESITTVDYIIRDKQFLKMLNGRYYYDQYGIMQILDGSADEHLIGKMVRFRSPATCASEDGQSICKYCYGHLYDINKELFSSGALAA